MPTDVARFGPLSVFLRKDADIADEIAHEVLERNLSPAGSTAS
jgi:hypothetical protein